MASSKLKTFKEFIASSSKEELEEIKEYMVNNFEMISEMAFNRKTIMKKNIRFSAPLLKI